MRPMPSLAQIRGRQHVEMVSGISRPALTPQPLHAARLRVRRCAGIPVGDVRLLNHSFNCVRDQSIRLDGCIQNQYALAANASRGKVIKGE